MPEDFRGLFYVVGIPNLDDSDGARVNVSDLLGVTQGDASDSTGNGAVTIDEATESQSDESGLQSNLLGEVSSNDVASSSGGHQATPLPVEPEDQIINDEVVLTATLTIRADTLLANMDLLDSSKHFLVSSDGIIMENRTVQFSEGESVFDVLLRETRASGIHMSFKNVPAFKSAYVEAIHNLYEFDAGALSGWVYRVNGWGPNFGASRYILEAGDRIEWLYTVDLGRDVGVTFEE
jgi:hypothetical protein